MAEFDVLAEPMRRRTAAMNAEYGRCHDQVWFHVHDAGDDEVEAADFLEFVARQGLRLGLDH